MTYPRSDLTEETREALVEHLFCVGVGVSDASRLESVGICHLCYEALLECRCRFIEARGAYRKPSLRRVRKLP